jgi:hypothetical protein
MEPPEKTISIDGEIMTISGNTAIINGETFVLPISSRRLAQVDRKWPGKHMYCSKHNYGPMDSWYNCEECCNETVDEFKAHQASDEYKEGWQLISEYKFTEGHPKIICPSRRKILRCYKMSTILKRIPRESAEAWMESFC